MFAIRPPSDRVSAASRDSPYLGLEIFGFEIFEYYVIYDFNYSGFYGLQKETASI